MSIQDNKDDFEIELGFLKNKLQKMQEYTIQEDLDLIKEVIDEYEGYLMCSIEESIEEGDSRVSELQDQVENLEEDNSELKNTVNFLKNEINDIDNRIHYLVSENRVLHK